MLSVNGGASAGATFHGIPLLLRGEQRPIKKMCSEKIIFSAHKKTPPEMAGCVVCVGNPAGI